MRVAVEGFPHSSVRICREEGKGRQWEVTTVSSEQAFALRPLRASKEPLRRILLKTCLKAEP